MKGKGVFYITLGCISVAFGALGAALPLLPSFPFLMLAAFCYGKSSESLNNWFMATKLYKNNLESFAAGKGMTWKTKFRILLMITATMTFGFIMMSRVPIGRIVLVIVWVFHIVYFVFGIKTISLPKHSSPEVKKCLETKQTWNDD